MMSAAWMWLNTELTMTYSSPSRNSHNPLPQWEAGSPYTAWHPKSFRTPSVSAFISLWGWGAGDEVGIVGGGVWGVESVTSDRKALWTVLGSYLSCHSCGFLGFCPSLQKLEQTSKTSLRSDVSWRVGRIFSQAIRTTAVVKECPLCRNGIRYIHGIIPC